MSCPRFHHIVVLVTIIIVSQLTCLSMVCASLSSAPPPSVAGFMGRAYQQQKQYSPEEIRTAHAEVYDPFEAVNRVIFDFNMALDGVIFKPLAYVYRGILPDPARESIHSALTNLKEPIIFLNDVVQLEGDRAMDTLARFLINSTLGIFGLFDVAEELGIESHSEDFGRTLAKYDTPSGPYIMLPILGPSNVRDLTGTVVDAISDPTTYAIRKAWGSEKANAARWVVTGTGILDYRERSIEFIDSLQRSLDPYATLRSLYAQRRMYGIGSTHEGNDDTPHPDEEDTPSPD